ncbi:MAG: helix-turn-helix transcriptional regulator [Lachnospiraceae bacterium]|nr:helix-turn-helix transcriptional regulator [Lachnospiraceae bacterium]
MTFGERLYNIRKDAGLSQEELAELMDVSRQSVSKWESDKAYPEMTRLLFLSDYFHVSLDYLMRGTEEVPDVAEKTPEKYTSEKMWVVWNTFTTNLTGAQRVMFMLLYVVTVMFMMTIVVMAVHGLGYEFGRFLGKIIYG